MAHRIGLEQHRGVTHDPDSVPVRSRTEPASQAGRWFLAGLGLFVALLGVLFVGLLGRSFLRAREMRSWPEVKCVILVSEIEERRHDEFSPTEFRQNLIYGYEWKGQAMTGTHLSLRENPWSSKHELAKRRVADFPAGAVKSCRVNPASPDIAVLKMDSLAPGYSIWFPGLFVVGGLGITIRALRKH